MKKLTCIFFTAILFISAGCKKSFFDINQNPNNPTPEALDAQHILPRALHRTAEKMAVSYGNYAGWMGYWARSGTYGPNAEEESYSITTTFEADEWTWFDILYDLDLVEKKAQAQGQTFYVGIAKIMKTFGFMYLVDQYNNVPYSKAFDLENNILPGYDKGEDIYAALLQQLDEGAKLIKDAPADEAALFLANEGLEAADIVFHGDATMWRKLANSQRLKLLIHEANVSGVNFTAEIAKITADGAGFLDNAGQFPTSGGAFVQPGYVNDNNKQNPFWGTYDTAVSGSPVNDFWRANNFILFQMYGVSGNNYGDSRLFYYFDHAATTVAPGRLQEQYYGYNYGEVIPNSDPKAANSADVSGPGISISATQPQWLFTTMETLFHQAEAIERGWLPGGTSGAEAKYREAITASFSFVGNGSDPNSDYTSAEEYLEQDAPDTFHARVLDFTGSSANKIRIINTQKYIALCGINNFEAWVDYRRLEGESALFGTADEQEQLLSLALGRDGKHIPVRIQYPQNEYNFNRENVLAQGTIDPQKTRVFWDTAVHPADQ